MQPQTPNDNPVQAPQVQSVEQPYPDEPQVPTVETPYVQPPQKPPVAAQILYALTLVMFIISTAMILFLIYGVATTGYSLLEGDSIAAEVAFVSSLIALILVRKIRSLSYLALKIFTGLFVLSLIVQIVQYFTLSEINKILVDASQTFTITMAGYTIIFILLALLWTRSHHRFVSQ